MRNQPDLTAGALGKRGKGGISQVLQRMPWKRKEKVESMDLLERRGVEITRSYKWIWKSVYGISQVLQ